jgi:hypothetical protein
VEPPALSGEIPVLSGETPALFVETPISSGEIPALLSNLFERAIALRASFIPGSRPCVSGRLFFRSVAVFSTNKSNEKRPSVDGKKEAGNAKASSGNIKTSVKKSLQKANKFFFLKNSLFLKLTFF